MINLYKVNGQLKARGKLLADYTEVIVANAKEQWLKDMKAEYELAYPKYTTETIVDEITNKEVDKLVEIIYDHTFDTWLLETEIVEPTVEEVRNEYGMVETPYKAEVTKLLREFVAPIVTEDMLAEYLKSRYAEIRKAEYPDMAMFADAWVKQDEEGMEAYRAKCLEVKAKYPK